MAEKSTTFAATAELEPKLSSYQDFHPSAEMNTDENCNHILIIHLPGFKPQQLTVKKLRPSNKILIQGERIDANNKRQRFNQNFKIPRNSNMDKIQAKWEKERLKIIIPKEMITVAKAKKEQVTVDNGEGQCRVYLGVGALGGVVALACAALGAYLSYIIYSKACP